MRIWNGFKLNDIVHFENYDEKCIIISLFIKNKKSYAELKSLETDVIYELEVTKIIRD